MKPMVVYVTENGKNITLAKEVFEKYLEDAYSQGFIDGTKSNMISYTPGLRNSKDLPTDYNTITCKNITSETVTTDSAANKYSIDFLHDINQVPSNCSND